MTKHDCIYYNASLYFFKIDYQTAGGNYIWGDPG